VARRVVDLLEISIVGDGLVELLKRKDLVVTGDHRDGAEDP
jgi:hypothetical protein